MQGRAREIGAKHPFSWHWPGESGEIIHAAAAYRDGLVTGRDGVTGYHQFPLELPKTSEMRSTMLRLADSVSKTPLNLQEASAALYPPIPYALLIILGL